MEKYLLQGLQRGLRTAVVCASHDVIFIPTTRICDDDR
jgi:hypothetical protein